MIERPDVLALLAAQFWVVGLGQLASLGVPRRTINRARQCGQVTVMLPGVLRMAHAPETFHSRAMALQLHAGRASYLSGTTAGALYGLREMPRRVIQITTRQNHRPTMPSWGRLLRTSWVHPDTDTTVQHGALRVAKPLPMLFGLAGQFNQHRFERAAEDAWHLGLVNPTEAAEYLQAIRRSGRGGVIRFEQWLCKTETRQRPSQSGFELAVLDAIRVTCLPEPRRQHPLTLPSGELIHVDLAWPGARLGVEPGHSWWHGGDLRARADAARDRACDVIGWRIVRYDEQARANLAAVGTELRQIYEERRRSLRAP